MKVRRDTAHLYTGTGPHGHTPQTKDTVNRGLFTHFGQGSAQGSKNEDRNS